MKAAVMEKWDFRLYVVGMTPVARRARENFKRICEKYLGDGYRLEVVNLLEDPSVAEREDIFAVPALVRLSPGPVRKIIGDLSDTDKVVSSLNLEFGER